MLSSDDPPAVEPVESVDSIETDIPSEEEAPLDPLQFCKCDCCKLMKTREESFCCKSTNYLQASGKNNFGL